MTCGARHPSETRPKDRSPPTGAGAERADKDGGAAFQDCIREVAGTQGGGPSATDGPARLADPKDKGAITAEEFEKAKAKVLS
ncbi:SHOCT domain-containing protein [Streptomyces sp. NPDC088757]|uniref:SHOCT domain-containing protein n=1 Tax=Streptomyces sp. NPDC088757 TaxID=3365889 RepID=UPI0037F338E2